MSLADAFAPTEARYREAVLQETWGHLAPTKNKKYRGRITWAVGTFGNDYLNPTAMVVELGDLESSPWFYNALNEWLQDLPEEHREVGCVYEFTGYFRNYKFDGTIRKLLDTNLVTDQVPARREPNIRHVAPS